jgi:hypothetical protein
MVSRALSQFLADHDCELSSAARVGGPARMLVLRAAVHFVLLPPRPSLKHISHVHQWLEEQGLDQPWNHRLKVLHHKNGIGWHRRNIYGFFATQATLAVHFKLRWV